ncbi:MAG: hypothetical protein JHC95_14715 [Solirubrobacteraceae bacterium]|nr:hypothetical protein [Solirubrobacteraceae bacterium]
MSYSTDDARQELLDSLAGAADELGIAVASLGDAYEQLPEQVGDRLEEALFRPVQSAYGRAKRTHNEFADRYKLPTRTFDQQTGGNRAAGAKVGGGGPQQAKGAIDHAVDAVEEADIILVALQDSMMPVEVGDPELRAGLAAVRELLDGARRNARDFERTLGR